MSFQKVYDPTIGVEFATKIIQNSPSTYSYSSPRLLIKKYKLQVWDTAGQERFEPIVKSYIRGCCCIFLCFDVNDRASFDVKVPHFLESFKQAGYDHTQGKIYIILVGLKADDHDHDDDAKQESFTDDDSTTTTGTRQVTRNEANTFANQNGFLRYCEVCAKDDWRTREPFQSLADYVHLYGLPPDSGLDFKPSPLPIPNDDKNKSNKKRWGYFLSLQQLFFVDRKKKSSNRKDEEKRSKNISTQYEAL